MSTKFTYDDVVRVNLDAEAALRPGAKAWIVGVTAEAKRRGAHYDAFDPGNVYTIEFEDGASIDVHEDDIELLQLLPANGAGSDPSIS